LTDALEELVQLLARLVADGEISEAQAAAILGYWQDRPQAELRAVLPLALAQGVGPLVDDDAAPLWPPVLPARATAASAAARRRLLDRAQDEHAAKMAWLCADLEAGRITVSEWQTAARRANAALLDFAVRLGGGPDTAALRQRVADIEREQAAYLQRFADGVSVRRLAAPVAQDDDDKPLLVPWALAYLARRLASYSGAGRGAFFVGLEGGAEMGPGWVVHYEARDDERTCSACRGAEGYYLPGQGPMPGDVCFGGGACRCVRVAVYDPARYAQLIGVGVTP
jgi:hypothetical protein